MRTAPLARIAILWKLAISLLLMPGPISLDGGTWIKSLPIALVSEHGPETGHWELGGQPAVVGLEVVSGENLRRRRLLLTTNTELNAIAAPAIKGLSSPRAASGMAATL